MTKIKKIIISTIVSIVTLGGLIACGGPDRHYGRFAAMHHNKGKFIAKRLDLNEEQKQNLENLLTTIKEQVQEHKDDHPREKIMDLLADPELNQEEALALVEWQTIKIKESAPIIIAAVAGFTNSLDNEQRSEIQKMMAESKHHGRPLDGPSEKK